MSEVKLFICRIMNCLKKLFTFKADLFETMLYMMPLSFCSNDHWWILYTTPWVLKVYFGVCAFGHSYHNGRLLDCCSVFVPCFVVHCFVSFLVLQSSWWGRERASCFTLSFWCRLILNVLWLLLTVLCVGLQCEIICVARTLKNYAHQMETTVSSIVFYNYVPFQIGTSLKAA